MSIDDVAAYIKELTDNQGVAVVTVKDGWVFTFTKERINQMMNALGNENYLTVFVKSSDTLPKN